MPLRALRFLVFGLPLGMAVFAVLMGTASLARLSLDDGASTLLNRLALVVVVLTITDALLLLTVLGVRALQEGDGGEPRGTSTESDTEEMDPHD